MNRISVAICMLLALFIAGCASTTTTKKPRRHARVYEQQVTVYQYQYYPSAEVYYYPQQRTYYWREDSRWNSGASVPTRIQIIDRPVMVDLDSDQPYIYHEKVKAEHPPKKDKKHKKDNNPRQEW